MKKIIPLLLITLTLSACQTTPTPEPLPQVVSTTLGDEVILTLTGTKMPCQATKPMQCLVVMDENSKIFGIPYDSIDNFRAESGKKYTLKLRPKLNQYSPDAENGIVGWHLVEVLSQN